MTEEQLEIANQIANNLVTDREDLNAISGGIKICLHGKVPGQIDFGYRYDITTDNSEAEEYRMLAIQFWEGLKKMYERRIKKAERDLKAI